MTDDKPHPSPSFWTEIYDPKEGRPIRDIPHTGICKHCGGWNGHKLDCQEVNIEQLAKIVKFAQRKEELAKEDAISHWKVAQRAIGKLAVLRHENNKLRKANDKLRKQIDDDR